ncbi:hypothetical protein [uncultured Sphingomonas sp.]|uniref:hypothetical protein n=1 Tax=uncultured Sphingomonas sp. TaxID=158754 RepID=UPI0035CB21EE
MYGNHRDRSGAVSGVAGAAVDAGPLAARADQAVASGDDAGAVALYHPVIGCAPATTPPLTLRLALMLLGHDRLPAAIEMLVDLAMSVPQSAKAWQTLGAA